MKERLPKLRFTPAMRVERRAEFVKSNDEIRRLRLQEHASLGDIGAQFGISAKRVSQIAPSGFRVDKNAR